MINVRLSDPSGNPTVNREEFEFDDAFGGRFVNHALDNGTIISQSPVRDYLPDADTLDAEQLQAMAEMHADQCIQTADDSHRNELAAAHARAKQLAPAFNVKIGRQIVIDSDGVTDNHWFAVIDHAHFGSGTSPDEAFDAALRRATNTAA